MGGLNLLFSVHKINNVDLLLSRVIDGIIRAARELVHKGNANVCSVNELTISFKHNAIIIAFANVKDAICVGERVFINCFFYSLKANCLSFVRENQMQLYVEGKISSHKAASVSPSQKTGSSL